MDQPLDLDRTVTSARRAAAAGERVIVLGVTGSGYSVVAAAAQAAAVDPAAVAVADPFDVRVGPGLYILMALGSFAACREVAAVFPVDPSELAGLTFGESIAITVYECATGTRSSRGLTILASKT